MHFKSSLPVVYITLNTLYHGTAAISAASWALDFRNLILPQNSNSPVPLGDFGGVKFQNLEVVRMTTQSLGTDGNEGVIADPDGLLHPNADTPSTTVAIIDPKTAPSGGQITVPAGKRLQSFDFFCCSSKKGESILEGHQCKQMKCKATAQSSGVGSDGKKVKQTDGVAVAALSSAASDTTPVASSLVLADSTADFATGSVHAVTITFTSDDLPVGGGATSRMRRRSRAAGMKGVDDMVLVIMGMVILPVGAEEA